MIRDNETALKIIEINAIANTRICEIAKGASKLQDVGFILKYDQSSELKIARWSKLQQGGHLKIPLWSLAQQKICRKTRTVKAGIGSQDLEPARDFGQAPARPIFCEPGPACSQLIFEFISKAVCWQSGIR